MVGIFSMRKTFEKLGVSKNELSGKIGLMHLASVLLYCTIYVLIGSVVIAHWMFPRDLNAEALLIMCTVSQPLQAAAQLTLQVIFTKIGHNALAAN